MGNPRIIFLLFLELAYRKSHYVSHTQSRARWSEEDILGKTIYRRLTWPCVKMDANGKLIGRKTHRYAESWDCRRAIYLKQSSVNLQTQSNHQTLLWRASCRYWYKGQLPDELSKSVSWALELVNSSKAAHDNMMSSSPWCGFHEWLSPIRFSSHVSSRFCRLQNSW